MTSTSTPALKRDRPVDGDGGGEAPASHWEACLARAAAAWGTECMAFAREDLASAAPLPALTIIKDAATFLAQRGYWEDPDAECLVALRACQIAHRGDAFISAEIRPTRFGGHGQPWELAEWLLADLEAAAWSLLPEVVCRCGARYKMLDNAADRRRRLFGAASGSASDVLLRPADRCRCGRVVGEIDTGEPGQLRLDVLAAVPPPR